ncbi:MAG: PLP-dependent aminotransferase family protein [Methanomassiliicoccaceae archaeon]|jgi:2-aminoadipate transaminase|nr:PLP-dependent aminotransferase family protein [Methanomassiliicoccaceae archaeon]
MDDMPVRFAKRISNTKASEIREILKITQDPEIISFAGGLPAPELFPVDGIKKADAAVLDESGMMALQYTTTEGYDPLRTWIADRLNRKNATSMDKDNILITHGSQQALDIAGKVFLDEGDVVLCESPTYLAAITAFRSYGCRFVGIPTDDDGMIMSDLRKAIKENGNVKIIYVIPNFQNPTGRTWSLERRKELAKISSENCIAVIEDDPYGEIRFAGEDIISVQSFDPAGNVLSTGTFSKIFCPGFRIGWIAGDERIIKKFVLVKQGTDLQCNTFAQMTISKYLEQNDIDEHIGKIKETYRKRRDVAVRTMRETFPEGVRFTEPEGGLFAWVELPENINARDVLMKCLERKVAFVPGGSFFPNGGHENTLRINFSNMPEDRIVKGLRIMADVIKGFV